MKCPVIVKFIRSDNKTLIVDGTDWILPNDGLDGFGEVSNDLSAVDKSVGDGSVLVSKRVNSIDREIKAVVTDKRLNQTLRYKATSFFNGKFSFKIFVTYMGRTRWCDGEIRKFFCPSENIYDKVYFSVTFFCANPFMKSEEDFGKNIAGVTPMVAFPYLCGLKTGEYKTTKSGKEITISGENTRIDAIQVHGESEQKQYSGKNLLKYREDMPTNIEGVSIVVNSDKSITLNGTPKNKLLFNINGGNGALYQLEPNVEYIMTGCPKGGTEQTYFMKTAWYQDDGKWVAQTSGNGENVKFKSPYKKYRTLIFVMPNVKCDNLTFYPMIRKATIQDSTYEPYVGGKPSPNPDYPQEIVSKPTKIESNGANGEKSVANILTPLCGIKVASGGNYTDENGQQWITDEIVKNADGSGTYVKRIYKKEFKDGSGFYKNLETSTYKQFLCPLSPPASKTINVNSGIKALCNRFNLINQEVAKNGFWIYSGTLFAIEIDAKIASTTEELDNWIKINNVVAVYPLATPQETPLSSEQLSQFSNLKTYKPHCVISNDGNIPMNLQYVTIVGGKKHIEGRPTGRFDFARKVELHNDGDVEAYCKAIFVAKGEVTNPKLIINGKYVRVITTMHSDDVLVIDFTKDPPTVRLNGKNIIGQTDRTSNFDGMQLNIGDSEIGYDADTGTGLLDVSIYYNKLYGTM